MPLVGLVSTNKVKTKTMLSKAEIVALMLIGVLLFCMAFIVVLWVVELIKEVINESNKKTRFDGCKSRKPPM